MAEYLDVFDASFTPVAPHKMERKETHRLGAWHQTFECWVLRRDPAGDKIVMQLRSAQKETYPGKLDISASGHLLAGERPEDGVRELEEELGLKANYDALYYLGVAKEALDEPGRQVLYGVRPEHCVLGTSGLPVDVVVVEPTGADTQLYCRFGGQEVTATIRDRTDCRPGDRIRLAPDLARAHVFDAASGIRLAA